MSEMTRRKALGLLGVGTVGLSLVPYASGLVNQDGEVWHRTAEGTVEAHFYLYARATMPIGDLTAQRATSRADVEARLDRELANVKADFLRSWDRRLAAKGDLVVETPEGPLRELDFVDVYSFSAPEGGMLNAVKL